MEKKELTNKNVVITGGSSGFGLEMASLFSENGANIIIWDIDSDNGEKVIGAIKKNGKSGVFFNVDIREKSQIKNAIEVMKKEFKEIDILINNAGVHQWGTGDVVETTEEEYDTVMDTNVKGAFLCSKYLIPLMKNDSGCSIINISSAWGLRAANKTPIYCASKAALIQLSKNMALDFAVKKIRVNCICPGTCRTPMVEKMVNLNYSKFNFNTPEDMWENRLNNHPLGRLGTPKDVAELALFLASDKSSWVTGAAIVIDGGYTLGKILAEK
jgi:NAD(P)-dependent dehydrogenase (short-subunit alcohol dehydrogenase family)